MDTFYIISPAVSTYFTGIYSILIVLDGTPTNESDSLIRDAYMDAVYDSMACHKPAATASVAQLIQMPTAGQNGDNDFARLLLEHVELGVQVMTNIDVVYVRT